MPAFPCPLSMRALKFNAYEGSYQREGTHKSRSLIQSFQYEVPRRAKAKLNPVVYHRCACGKVFKTKFVVGNGQFLFSAGKLSDHCRSADSKYLAAWSVFMQPSCTVPLMPSIRVLGPLTPRGMVNGGDQESCHATPLNRLIGRNQTQSLSLDWSSTDSLLSYSMQQTVSVKDFRRSA